MATGNGIRSDLYELTVPLLAVFEQVALDGNFDALDWAKLEQIVKGAMKEGCANQGDVDEVTGAVTVPKSFNARRLGEIYKCLDGKTYGRPGRIPEVIGKVGGRAI
ncbi:hypothetical protein [Stenotrophomonas sp. BIO128-Bstrain]|uniref:hypothetical protein n=1 Tax=Stenotrophomonas sp. BIO128-Bstrain TaxID=3027225 RepID=UPI0024DE726B|nr:hypothetical protein [Stenotrophomonas sp. BIO128-Bstrain]WIA63253.1 hypothetical protein POS15_08585 [Stenotrophomonas sp. BIO128-Bstrain]